MAFTERYVTDAAAGGGDGTSGTPWTLAEALTSAVAGDRVNVQSDGAYSLGADTVSNAGTQPSAIVFRGYNATIGDLTGARTSDNGALITTDYPAITLTGILTPNAYVIFESLKITGSLVSAMISSTSIDNYSFVHCDITNSRSSNTSVQCVRADNSVTAFNSDFSLTGITHGDIFDGDSLHTFIACRFKSEGTGVGSACIDIQDGLISGCLLWCEGGSHGISKSNGAGTLKIIGNTIYNAGTAILFPSAAMTAAQIVALNHITDCTKFIDSEYSGTANGAVLEFGNRTRDNTTPRTGVGDWPVYGEVTTDTGDNTTDYTSASGGDFTLIDGAPGRSAGAWLHKDIGAFQADADAVTPAPAPITATAAFSGSITASAAWS
jgi:hypothetical protein